MRLKKTSKLVLTKSERARIYIQKMKQQLGVCWICGNPPKTRKLAIDHNHKTGKLRGLLCWSCNYGLGYYRDNKDAFQGLVSYLKYYEGI